MLEPRTEMEWFTTTLRVLFWLSVLWAVARVAVVVQSAGWV